MSRTSSRQQRAWQVEHVTLAAFVFLISVPFSIEEHLDRVIPIRLVSVEVSTSRQDNRLVPAIYPLRILEHPVEDRLARSDANDQADRLDNT